MNKEALANQYRTMTLREIALLEKVSHETVRQRMIGFDIPRRKVGRRSRIDTNFIAYFPHLRDRLKYTPGKPPERREAWYRKVLDKLLGWWL